MNYERLDKLVDSYRDELIENIRKWVAIPSVQGEPAGQNAPFGVEVRRMLDTALEDGARFGFDVRDIDGYAGDISYGSGPQTMGMLAHLDVVPLGEGWKHDPLGGEIEDGRLYGRGTTDDKGPALCALYAMRAVKEAGIPLKHGVRLILGCDEETGMSDMRHYAEKVSLPDYGFSPDAEFPVINIEKGGINLRLTKVTGGEAGAPIPVYSLYAGERPNVVPAEAVAEVGLEGITLAALKAALSDIEKAHAHFRLKAEASGEGRARIVATGVNGHAAMPHRGVNAAGMLLIALRELKAGREGGSREAIAMLAEAVGMDYTGNNLGIACEDDLSGALTCNLGILRYDQNELSALLDIRYPVSGVEATILGQAAKRVGPAGMSVCCATSHTPLHVPAESRIVRGLLKVYHEVTGLPAYTIAIGGGTYSRTMPNTVAFGVCFPGDMDVCHIADEYIDLNKMMLGVRIFAHAIAELAGASAGDL
ncbi:MAG: dipeptidase PepV [Clostridia bacterium]|nr:dipeptidase PepV [Clostridia bacterium]